MCFLCLLYLEVFATGSKYLSANHNKFWKEVKVCWFCGTSIECSKSQNTNRLYDLLSVIACSWRKLYIWPRTCLSLIKSILVKTSIDYLSEFRCYHQYPYRKALGSKSISVASNLEQECKLRYSSIQSPDLQSQTTVMVFLIIFI